MVDDTITRRTSVVKKKQDSPLECHDEQYWAASIHRLPATFKCRQLIEKGIFLHCVLRFVVATRENLFQISLNLLCLVHKRYSTYTYSRYIRRWVCKKYEPTTPYKALYLSSVTSKSFMSTLTIKKVHCAIQCLTDITHSVNNLP